MPLVFSDTDWICRSYHLSQLSHRATRVVDPLVFHKSMTIQSTTSSLYRVWLTNEPSFPVAIGPCLPYTNINLIASETAHKPIC